VNNPFTVAIQLSESDTGFIPTSSLFTIHRTRKAEMSGSVRKIFWKAFHFTTDISSADWEVSAEKVFEDAGIGDSLPLTLQRTFLSQNAGIKMRNFQKICAPAFAKAGACCICGYEI